MKFLMNDDDCVYEALNQCYVSNSAVNALIIIKGQAQKIGDETQSV